MRFFANLNVFLSSFNLLAILVLFIAFLLHVQSHLLTYLMVLPAGILAIIWLKRGLSPLVVDEKAQRRFQQGHLLIGLINLCTAIGLIMPLATFQFSNVNLNIAVSELSGLVTIISFLSLPLLIIGLVMIWSSANAQPSISVE